ncbi:MAG: D-alanine--D-alanine ligase [Planctomycetia bacterium]|nr:D-alanine--D-alanine ligase [Planctomycetia bacterium]
MKHISKKARALFSFAAGRAAGDSDRATPDGLGLRVAVLAGGDSAERPISLASGERVAAAMRRGGHGVESFDPAATDLDAIDWSRFDACFIALHGGAGEDGRIQERLAARGVPFTGSDARASRLALCKSASKERFRQEGVPTLPYVLVHETDSPDEIAHKAAGLAFPLVVKPDGQGSSLGLGLARNARELSAAVTVAAALDPFVLVEPYLAGREFTVALLGRRPLPIVEIVTPGGLFDYEAKYESAMTEHRFESGLSSDTIAQIEQTAIAAAEALGTSGLARVDLIVDRHTRLWVLEVNTVPGMSPHSLAPKAAARAGYDLSALCEWMLEDCLATEVTR